MTTVDLPWCCTGEPKETKKTKQQQKSKKKKHVQRKEQWNQNTCVWCVRLSFDVCTVEGQNMSSPAYLPFVYPPYHPSSLKEMDACEDVGSFFGKLNELVWLDTGIGRF